MKATIKEHIIVTFRDWSCKMVTVYYGVNKAKALQFIDTTDDSLVATASVNMPDYDLKDDEIFIKDYSENEGMADALIKADIIEEKKIGIAYSGHVTIYKYKLTQKGRSLWSE